MNPFPSDTASTPPLLPGGAEAGAGSSADPTPPVVGPLRADPAEVRRLRSRLLKLILRNQVQRESERSRGLPFRGAG